jgi:hypothetical protein
MMRSLICDVTQKFSYKDEASSSEDDDYIALVKPKKGVPDRPTDCPPQT